VSARARVFEQILVKNTREKGTRFFLRVNRFPSSVFSSHVSPSSLRFFFGREARRVQALYYCATDRARRSRHTCLPRSPVLQPLPTRAAIRRHPLARGCRGIDIYEVRWLVAFPYATFGYAGTSGTFRIFLDLSDL